MTRQGAKCCSLLPCGRRVTAWRLLQQNAEAAGREAVKRPDALSKSNRHATLIRGKMLGFRVDSSCRGEIHRPIGTRAVGKRKHTVESASRSTNSMAGPSVLR